MARSRSSVLLTGFGPFPGVADNATAALVPELAARARRRFPKHAFIDEVLPVEWSRAPKRLTQLLQHPATQLALHFGVSKRADGFRIELIGRNACDVRQDAAGALPTDELILSDAPATLASTFPAERIIARLERAGLPCGTSEDAGGYLCNALLYHSLSTARERAKPFIAGFIHLPASLSPFAAELPEEATLTWDEALAGGIEIIAACLDGRARA